MVHCWPKHAPWQHFSSFLTVQPDLTFAPKVCFKSSRSSSQRASFKAQVTRFPSSTQTPPEAPPFTQGEAPSPAVLSSHHQLCLTSSYSTPGLLSSQLVSLPLLGHASHTPALGSLHLNFLCLEGSSSRCPHGHILPLPQVTGRPLWSSNWKL